jgi:hypothetical protein
MKVSSPLALRSIFLLLVGCRAGDEEGCPPDQLSYPRLEIDATMKLIETLNEWSR